MNSPEAVACDSANHSSKRVSARRGTRTLKPTMERLALDQVWLPFHHPCKTEGLRRAMSASAHSHTANREQTEGVEPSPLGWQPSFATARIACKSCESEPPSLESNEACAFRKRAPGATRRETRNHPDEGREDRRRIATSFFAERRHRSPRIRRFRCGRRRWIALSAETANTIVATLGPLWLRWSPRCIRDENRLSRRAGRRGAARVASLSSAKVRESIRVASRLLRHLAIASALLRVLQRMAASKPTSWRSMLRGRSRADGSWPSVVFATCARGGTLACSVRRSDPGPSGPLGCRPSRHPTKSERERVATSRVETSSNQDVVPTSFATVKRDEAPTSVAETCFARCRYATPAHSSRRRESNPVLDLPKV